MIGRIVRSADFERVLATPIRARTAHFAIHYLHASPSRPSSGRPASVDDKLSTGSAPEQGDSVDDSVPGGCWLGAIVPKRHARRAVTRTLLKRQIRDAAAAQDHAGLAHGLWVVRLRSAFDKVAYPSASSQTLKAVAAQELARVFADVAQRIPRASAAG